MSALINFFLPESNLRFFIITDDLKNVLMKFLYIFVLLSFCDSFAERINLLEGLFDSVL
jgi:hypothetical protein